MARILEGKPAGKGRKIGVVVSKFNGFVTERLLEGCLKELRRLGVREKDILVARVPGSLEIPVTALRLARRKTVNAVVCLGAVIRGETLHFDLVARGAARGIAEVSVISGKPVIFGVLTTDTVDQACKRSDIKKDNKGRDAATAALEMIDLMAQIR
ncbi:MAG: 6,7-dimethyl-8-ribityllumazine synthase [Candidatus Omnitrophica bacterium]|nr:6,7-dimethyl-8-ribityllumazine synthase [Candidatus Omnitrophota bacterium]